MSNVDLNRLQKFIHNWLETLMDALGQTDEEIRQKVLESTGRSCARTHATKLFQTVKNNANSIDDALDRLNQQIKGTNWQRTSAGEISVEYERCFCPLVGANLVTSPTRCYCSVGWVKENLEIILERPVTVKLEKAVGRGDSMCRFLVKF